MRFRIRLYRLPQFAKAYTPREALPLGPDFALRLAHLLGVQEFVHPNVQAVALLRYASVTFFTAYRTSSSRGSRFAKLSR